jgi:hypothetical protein
MNRFIALIVWNCIAIAQVTPNAKPTLIRLTDELDAAIRSGEWNKAADLSTALKAATFDARDQSMSNAGAELADQFLDWLPPNTETVVVAKQPFRFPEPNINRVPEPLPMAEAYPLLMLAASEKESLGKKLAGRTLRFAAIGAREFGKHETQHGLGMISLEGCAVYSFIEPVQESLFERKPDESVMGHPVWISKGSFGDAKETDTFLVALPHPDLILACNNRDFFSTMVSRMSTPQKPRALPADLPEWKHVDRSAPLWGLRHVSKEGFDPGWLIDPEKKSIHITGLTVEFAASGAKASVFANQNPWAKVSDDPQFEGKASTKKSADGVWGLNVAGNGPAGGMAVFVLMAMLGFVVAV